MAKRRNNKPNRKGKDVERTGRKDEAPRRGVEASTNNDASWYGASPQLLADAASLSYNTPSGVPYDIIPRSFEPDLTNIQDGWSGLTKGTNAFVPGVMALDVLMIPGYSEDNSSAVSVAMRNIYSFIRHANSGHSNYDPVDLMLYLLAMDSAYAWYASLVRLYGTLGLYAQRNRYFPEALTYAQGFNFHDCLVNLANLRYIINNFAKRLGSLCVPADMTIFTRHSWLFSNYYVDDESVKGQIYLYRPSGFHFYNELEGAGKLDYVDWKDLVVDTTTHAPYGVSDIASICDRFVNSLMLSEDIGIMSGDILKAYGENGLLKLGMIAEDFAIAPQYSKEVLSQIQNATIYNRSDFGNLDITQDTSVNGGAIIFKPTININEHYLAPYMGGRVLNMYKDDVTPDDTMVATRMMAIINPNNNSELIVGSEIVVGCDIIGIAYAVVDNVITAKEYHDIADVYYASYWNGQHPSHGRETRLGLLSAFDYHPAVWESQLDNNWVAKYASLHMQMNNYTTIFDNELRKMHDTALLSLWNVPQMGFYNG